MKAWCPLNNASSWAIIALRATTGHSTVCGSYYLNLSSHPAYADFRKLRAALKAAGKPLSSLALADGLRSYSERGQAYVDTLKGIIRTNKLDRADDAEFRDEARRFVVTADSEDEAAGLREEVEKLRESGELAEIITRMRLD